MTDEDSKRIDELERLIPQIRSRHLILIAQLTLRVFALEQIVYGEQHEDKGGVPLPLEDLLKSFIDAKEVAG